MHIFLPGASGFVGERVLADLLACGHTVTALTHSEWTRNRLRQNYPQIKIATGDVANAQDMLRAIPPEAEGVIYLPGLLRESRRTGLTFRRVHVEGVRNILAAAKRAKVKRWIQMSALGANSPSFLRRGLGGGNTEYFRTKFEAEELVRNSGLEWTILRPSLIFDDRPRHQHNFVQEVANAIRMAPFVPILGNGNYLLQPISLDDVSQTAAQALTRNETVSKIYELGGPERLTYEQVVKTIALAIGAKKPAVNIPMWAIMSVARILGRFSWFPITVDEIAMLRDGNYVRDAARDSEVRETFELPMKRFKEFAVQSLHG